MWDLVALLGVIVLAAGACVGVGLAIMRGENKIAKAEAAAAKQGIKQGKLATEATGDVLKKIREREFPHSGPLDRAAVRRLFGDRGGETDPPSGGAS